jgi:hypothetical protein
MPANGHLPSAIITAAQTENPCPTIYTKPIKSMAESIIFVY